MVIYNLITKLGKRRSKYNTFFRKENRRKQNSVRIMRSVHEKGTVFSVKLKLQGESFG